MMCAAWGYLLTCFSVCVEEGVCISCCSQYYHAQVLIIKDKVVEAASSVLRYLIWDAEDQVGPFYPSARFNNRLLAASLKDSSRQMPDLSPSGVGWGEEGRIVSLSHWQPPLPGCPQTRGP